MKTLANKIAMIFPGGGVQYPGMGKQLYENHPSAREVYDEIEDTLREPLKAWSFDADQSHLMEMRKSLLAIYAYSVANYRVFMEVVGKEVDFMAGHSLGEYSALTCAQALNLKDGTKVVNERARLLEEAGDANYTMMAVNKVSEEKVERLSRDLVQEGAHVYLSVYNSDLQSVVSGDLESIQRLKQRIEEEGAECRVLNIKTASHCPLLSEQGRELENYLKAVPISNPKIPVVSNFTAETYPADADWCHMLHQQLVNPVRWKDSIEYLGKCGVGLVIDSGPQEVLKQLTSYQGQSFDAVSINSDQEINYAASKLEALNFFNRFLQKCMVYCMSTKNRNPVFPNHAVKYYDQIKTIQQRAKVGSISIQELEAALRLTASILEEKNVRPVESEAILEDLSAEIKQLNHL